MLKRAKHFRSVGMMRMRFSDIRDVTYWRLNSGLLWVEYCLPKIYAHLELWNITIME